MRKDIPARDCLLYTALNFLIHSGKTIDLITYGIFVISGAGSDNHQKLIAFAGEDEMCIRDRWETAMWVYRHD